MLILIRLLTLITPFIVALPYWFVFESLKLMITAQVVSVVLILICYFLFSKISKSKINWPSLILIEVFVVNIYLLSLLMERRIFLYTLSILTFLVVWAWLELMFKKTVVVNESTESNPSKTLHFLIYTSFFTTLFGFREFLVWPVWVMLLISFIYVFYIFNHWLIVESDVVDRWKQRLMVALIQVQLFLVLLVLPLPYYSKGALMSASYFFISGIFDLYQKQRLTLKTGLTNATIFLVFLMLILLTTKW